MNDMAIADKLRWWVTTEEPTNGVTLVGRTLRRDLMRAADEIERLRAALADCEAERDRYHQLAVGEKQ